MSNIEPTEEQKQAAFEFFARDQPNAWHQDWIAGHVVSAPANNDEEAQAMVDLARLLAEREAKLQARIDDLTEELAATDTTEMRLRAELKTERIVAEKACAARNDMENERDAARRDLKQSKAMSEAARDTLRARVAELEADLAAFMFGEAQHLADIRALRELLREARRHLEGRLFRTGTGLLDDLDRVLDDAKADAPAVDMQAWANGSCPEPGCSLANPHKQGAACVKPTAEGGEGFSHACGVIAHVGECGDYECHPGVDGWQLKAGAR